MISHIIAIAHSSVKYLVEIFKEKSLKYDLNLNKS